MKINAYLSLAIINVSIIILVGLGLYWTRNLWVLLGLFFMTSCKIEKKGDK